MTWSELQHRYVEAMGGRARLQAMKSVSMNVTVTDAEGTVSRVHILKSRPNKARILVTLPGDVRMTQGYDGTQAWQRVERGNNTVTRLMDESAARSFIHNATIEGPLVRPDQFGATVDYRGVVTLPDSIQAHEVILTFPDGSVTTYYLDTQTLTEQKYITTRLVEGQTLTTESFPSDYRMVDGVLFAFRTTDRRENGESAQAQLESVKINPGLLETVFKMPTEPSNDH